MSDAPPPADAPPPPNGDAAPAGGTPPAAPRPAAAKRTGPRPWQGGRFHATGGRGPGGRLRTILILLAVILALSGALAAWVLYPRNVPQPYFTAIAIDQYRDPRVPVNQWTAQDREALRGRGWPESNAFTSQQRNVLVEELRTLGRNQPADQPLVIYLNAYALPTADAGLAVLPGDADLDDEKTWLPLSDVLDFVKGCPVQRKLLLLDVARPFADPRAGALTNDAAARAEPIVRKAVEGDPNLLVLCACSPGQTSSTSEEMGHTVFVHYVIEGLTGKADGFGGAVKDNRVTARELAGYVTANVERWAWRNRGSRQTPELLGPDGLDMALAVDMENPAAATADAPLDKTYPQGLRDAWDLRDRWKADPRVPTPPALCRELEEAASHAERRWRGGAAADDVLALLKEQTGGLERQRAALPGATVHGEPPSLARAIAEGRKQPPQDKVEDAISQLRYLAELQQRAAAVPPDPEATAQLEPRKKAFLKDYDDKPFDLAWTVFQAAKEHPESLPERLRFWVGLLKPEGKPAPDYAEIHFLEALSALEVKDPAGWPVAAVAAAVQLAEGAEQAHTELDLTAPAAAPPLADWLRKWASEADDRRQAAEDLLLNAKPADRAKATQPLDAALNDARGYQSLKEALRGLRAALRCRDEALTLLPGYVAYLEHERDRLGDWEKALGQARTLRDRLAKPPAEGPSPEWFRETDAQMRALRGSLDNLWQPVNSRLHALIPPTPQSGAADAEDMRALLRLPALSAPDRQAVWAAWRELAGRLNDDEAAGASARTPPTWNPEAAARDERARAMLRARTSLALLRLGGADVTQAEADQRRAADDDAALLALGRDLRDAWKRLGQNRSH